MAVVSFYFQMQLSKFICLCDNHSQPQSPSLYSAFSLFKVHDLHPLYNKYWYTILVCMIILIYYAQT